ncbi:MAG: ABC transporter substrate-binding protein [Candidatus Micrarchaeia archaeon]
MRMVLVMWMALLFFSLLSLYPSKSGDSRNVLRIGVIKTIDTIHPYVAARQGYFDEEGIDYKIYSFGTSPALAEAIAAGEIDVAYMSFIPAAVWIGRGSQMKIVAGASRSGDIVCAREPVFSGKIAISKKGTMTENVYNTIIKGKTHLVPVYGIEPSDMPTALLVTKDVDAVLTWEPFSYKIEESGGVCIIDAGVEWEKDHGTKYQRNVLVVSKNIINNRPLLEKVLRIHNITTKFLNSPSSYPIIVDVMGVSGFKKERVEYNAELDWESMDEMMRTAVREGYLDHMLDYEDLVYSID